MKNPSIFLTALSSLLLFAPVSALQAEAKPQPGPVSQPAKPNVKPYPLKTCIVSDDELGSMSKPVVFHYKGAGNENLLQSLPKGLQQGSRKVSRKIEVKLASEQP